ncbi:hypothetical protein AAX09_03790 [Moraxella bovoculi]|uniref:VENN motif pre-toxin domain-containing protein n=1 Tax=Moraxella bovoculi TaxID=386891 RepID=UPI000624A0BE|nr:VENN motif pre-toxin domain-containing protein [Moraxella bovoculi]AKG18655.1 hypothetical protein AAX09_03790 [Moraxella bovoculi]
MYAPNSNGIIGDVARAASPELAYRIGQEFKENKALNQTDNGNRPEEQSLQHLLAHAILGAATSYAAGNDITTGALSGAGSEVAAPVLANYLYGTKDPSELNQEQKDTITSILNLATATAIYTATDGSAADAVSAAEVGKVGMEWNFNAIQQSSAANARACRGGKVSACEVRNLGDILGEYADKYHDLTIYSVGLGAVSYTVIVNNKNGNVWVGGVPESDNYRAGYGLSTHPRNLDLRNLIKTLEEDAKNGKTPRVIDWKLGVSAQAGTVVGATTPEEVDKAIGGRSLGAQACHVGCLSISKGEGKDGAVILAIGAGTSQIGIGGNVMRQLTDNEKKTLKDLGLLR